MYGNALRRICCAEAFIAKLTCIVSSSCGCDRPHQLVHSQHRSRVRIEWRSDSLITFLISSWPCHRHATDKVRSWTRRLMAQCTRQVQQSSTPVLHIGSRGTVLPLTYSATPSWHGWNCKGKALGAKCVACNPVHTHRDHLVVRFPHQCPARLRTF
jgi:hypothetical protein